MKKITGLFVSAMLLLSSCGSVPVTGRSQLLLVSDSEVLTSSLTQYSEYMKSAPLSTDTKGKAMVTRVGKRIASATEEYLKAFTCLSFNGDCRQRFQAQPVFSSAVHRLVQYHTPKTLHQPAPL